MDIELNQNNRWSDLHQVLMNESPFAPDYEPSQELVDWIHSDAKILVVGAGGLGCDILKCLAMSGIKSIDVIDLDEIDITNLNRQFLFRMNDVGKFKSNVAAKFINTRVAGCNVTPHVGKIQDKGLDFYEQFQIIIAGLDNVEARRWLNSLIHSMVEFDENGDMVEGTQRFMVDGGTEAWKGQARVIKPYETACYECTMATIPKQVKFQACTIASIPRKPEHCIAWAFEMQWPKEHKDRHYDTDSAEDMTWIYKEAEKRAAQYGIEGVTFNLTLGVVKNIIPAIASTNAIIAAACVSESIKLLSGCSMTLNNNWQYVGNMGTTSSTLEYIKEDNCIVCSNKPIDIKVPKKCLFKDFIGTQKIKDEWYPVEGAILLGKPYDFKNPSLTTENDKQVWFPMFKEDQVDRLPKTMEQLVKEGLFEEREVIHITDKSIKVPVKVKITLE